MAIIYNWSTTEKKSYLSAIYWALTLPGTLLANSCASIICTDDVIRLFIDWIGLYHEAHFYVIKEVFHNRVCIRGEILDKIHGERPRKDSAEADLFKMLIRDLSMGGVIRQFRATNYFGQYIKKTTHKYSSSVLKSAFDDEEQYELTEPGKQFVHYAMTDVVPKLGESTEENYTA